MKFLGHWRIFFFRVAKTEKKMSRGIYWGKSFLKREKLTKFLGFWANSFYSGGKVHQSCQNCNLRSLGRLWGKNHVLNFAHCFKFPWNLRQKNKSFIQKNFFRVVTNAIRASTGKFCGKSILSPEKLCFLLEIWICSNFFCPVANKLSRWAKTAMHVFRGNICRNFTLKNCFFQLFAFRAEKLGFFMEK